MRRKKTVFIAMPFHEEFKEVYQAIREALIGSNYIPYRVDELKFNNDIVQDIEEGIRDSFLVLADLTTKNPNVFYEVGYARAIGKGVISMTQNPEDVPFDLRQRRYIKYSKNQLTELVEEIKVWISHIERDPLKYSTLPQVKVHGTKYNVPNANEFWNDLCFHAHEKFYLLGFGNKSWIEKDDSQSIRLAESMVDIVANNGKVKIISDNLEETIHNHRSFFNTFVKDLLITEELKQQWKSNFEYGVSSYSNYQAVISDGRLVILPRMNSKNFVNESLVLEIEGEHLQAYKNYQADVERMFRERDFRVIELFSNK